MNVTLFSNRLTHYSPVLLFYTPWKHQKTFTFSDVFWGYWKATLGWNGLNSSWKYSWENNKLPGPDWHQRLIENLEKIRSLTEEIHNVDYFEFAGFLINLFLYFWRRRGDCFRKLFKRYWCVITCFDIKPRHIGNPVKHLRSFLQKQSTAV